MSSLIQKILLAGEYRNTEAAKILAEVVNKVDQQISPPKFNFLEVLDISSQVTSFDQRQKPVPSETQIVGDIILKTCSYMYERSHSNQDSKELVKELIILSARLYANIILNEEPETKREV